MGIDWITPDWLAPVFVCAAITTRQGGVSASPFDEFNLADHVEDDPDAVAKNRLHLAKTLRLPQRPTWMRQVHGVEVIEASSANDAMEADAIVSRVSHAPCAVLTADCLPVLFCHEEERVIGAAHAGWRGLAAGVLEATVKKMEVDTSGVLAYLGPAIGPEVFEVGRDVFDAFIKHDAQANKAFKSLGNDKYLADVYLLAKQRLESVGVTKIYGGGLCTYTNKSRFYSYRRDVKTGRMASIIWFADADADESIEYDEDKAAPTCCGHY